MLLIEKGRIVRAYYKLVEIVKLKTGYVYNQKLPLHSLRFYVTSPNRRCLKCDALWLQWHLFSLPHLSFAIELGKYWRLVIATITRYSQNWGRKKVTIWKWNITFFSDEFYQERDCKVHPAISTVTKVSIFESRYISIILPLFHTASPNRLGCLSKTCIIILKSLYSLFFII